MKTRKTVHALLIISLSVMLLPRHTLSAPDSSTVHLTSTRAPFSTWKSPAGAWVCAGDAFKKPDAENRLGFKSGKGVFVNGKKGRTSHLFSRIKHGDVKAHIEFMVPRGSNSGVYFQGRYEIQVFDSWNSSKNRPKEHPKHSDCGGIYQRWGSGGGYEGRPPKVNACKAPGKWQSFDVIFRAPRFNAKGEKIKNAVFVRVVHNGTVIHENESLTGPTRAAAFNDEKPLGPLMLQGDHGPVAYRNVQLEIPDAYLQKQADALVPGNTFEAIRKFTYGTSRKPIAAFEETLRSAPPALWRIWESKLLAILDDPQAQTAGKQAACRILTLIGTCRSVPALGRLLGDKELSYMACAALQNLPCKTVDAAFRDALSSVDEPLKPGIISSIAERGGCGAVETLGALAGKSDVTLARAAVKALGRIGTKEADRFLAEAEVNRLLRREKANSRLQCADSLLQQGRTAQAAAIYSELTDKLNDPLIRKAAKRGLLKASQKKGAPDTLKMKKG